MFLPTNVRRYDVNSLNRNIVAKFEEHPDIIELLDYWVLLPDADIVDRLEEMVPTIQKIQPPKLPAVLYRGFTASGYQDTMGLVKNGFFSNSLDKTKIGKVTTFALHRPLSFTTSREIAKGFGDHAVTVQSSKVVKHSIWISEEICYLISKRRNLKDYQTNDEVIVLPSVKSIAITLLAPEAPSSKW